MTSNKKQHAIMNNKKQIRKMKNMLLQMVTEYLKGWMVPPSTPEYTLPTRAQYRFD